MSTTLPSALCPIETEADKLIEPPYSGSVRRALQATGLLRGAMWSSRCKAPLWACCVSVASFEWLGSYDSPKIERLLRYLLDRPEELASRARARLPRRAAPPLPPLERGDPALH